MNTLSIIDTGTDIQVPSSWDELSRKDVQWVFKTYTECLASSPLDFHIRLLYRFLNMKPTFRNRLAIAISEEAREQFADNVEYCCRKLLDWVLEENDGELYLTFDSIINPLPTVRVGLSTLIGPADGLQDLSFAEFRAASSAMETFTRSKDVKALDECISILYRPKGKINKAGRAVGEFDYNRITTRYVKHLSLWKKNLIITWFASCLKFIQGGKIELNSEPVDLSLLFHSDSDKVNIPFTWNDLVIEIAKERSIGNVDEVDSQSLYTILGILWHNYKEQQRYEQMEKAHKA